MSELNRNGNFLADNEKAIVAFADTVHGQLDHAMESRENDGSLTLPLNDVNLFAAKWQMDTPALPEHLANVLPFQDGEQVMAHARYRYGTAAALINVWLSNVDGDFRSFSLGLRVDPETGEVGDSIMNGAGSDRLGKVDIDSEDTRAIMDAIFVRNSEYEEWGAALPIADAFRFGIASQVDYGAEQYTAENAEKIFAAHSRTGNAVVSGQFSLQVHVVDRAHPNNKPSQTEITLRRRFEPCDYSSAGIYEGVFEQELTIVREPDGRISDISRKSSISFANEPAVTKVNGQETVVSMYNDAGDELPPELARRLYPDTTPTLDDLAYFHRLITEPIQETDVYI